MVARLPHVEIEVEADGWATIDFHTVVGSAVQAVLDASDITADKAEVSVLACDDARISSLNAEFRGKPIATNVLSWPADTLSPYELGGLPTPPRTGPDGLVSLGDIAISWETCAREAKEARKTVTDHATHLVVHGTLHLLGYDHETDPDADRMESLERKILGKLGIDDPYSDR